jgi:fumarate hydratase class I
MIKIELPTDEHKIRSLTAGDNVALYGTIITARDAAHKFMVEKWPEFVTPLIKNGAIYHCGPIVSKKNGVWQTISAGPTTSNREEHYQWRVIEHYGVRIIIGKGGMGPETLNACKKYGAVYVHVTGGAAALIAEKIVKTKNVYMLDELGSPEAFWELEVADFQGVVTMDSKGHSLHRQVREETEKRRNAIIGLS